MPAWGEWSGIPRGSISEEKEGGMGEDLCERYSEEMEADLGYKVN